MTAERRPLLAFGPPVVGDRPSQRPRDMPRISKPTGARQSTRLLPQFRKLAAAFEAERARLAADSPDEVDPALVVVFDLAGTVQDFQNAIDKIDGFEFLSQFLGDTAEPNDDFHMTEREAGRTDKYVQHSLYMVMSSSKAIDELIRLFALWQQDPARKLEHGLGKFKYAFQQLTSIRRWGPEDRIRETGLRKHWQETLTMIGQSINTVKVEVELWYRREQAERAEAESHVEQIIVATGGRILDSSQIGSISYHALLVELPIQQVQAVLRDGAEAIHLLTADDVMFVSPFTPMTITPVAQNPVAEVRLRADIRVEGSPRVALLDGLPFQNHDALAGRLLIDDPDGVADDYPITARNHGTAMASLIIHGDLSSAGDPLDRPLYVRPIMRPDEFSSTAERVYPDQLFPDLLHRAIRRIQEGEGGHEATAPSVRIINLSIGAQVRALTRRMSPVGRLLDWLAQSYNLLFIVSAGNHTDPITIPATSAKTVEDAQRAAVHATYSDSILKGILPPGDALNALTVGATHDDGLGCIEVADSVWDITSRGVPAYYGATGPGVGRSIKPDLHYIGGRALYVRPIIGSDEDQVDLELARTAQTGPGLQVAAPAKDGAKNKTAFTFGTSNATALVTREASRLFDILESGIADPEESRMPDAQYHPLLVRALLAHESSWGGWKAQFCRELDIPRKDVRRKLSALLGYGKLDPARLGTAATNRAVLVSGGRIGGNERHTYEVPLPPSLRSRAEWHCFTITLAYAAPTVGELSRYRRAKVYFDTPDTKLAAGDRIEGERHAVRRGSLQHEIVQGSRAMTFEDGDIFPVHVECMDDAKHLAKDDKVRYALVVSVETAEGVSTAIHDEVRVRLRQRARERAQERVRG